MCNHLFARDLGAYAAYVDNSDDILMSASGGVATAFAKHVIRQGGVVAGVAYNNDFSGAEYILVDHLDEVDKLRGSKVVPAATNNIFEKVACEAVKGRFVLFFGLPCMIAVAKQRLKPYSDSIIFCELICSGRTFARVHKDYCSYLQTKFNAKLTSFSVRTKKDSWLPEYLFATFSNGKQFIHPFKRTEYGQGFKILKHDSCLDCSFKGDKRQGDIMIGDFWGAKPDDNFWNGRGVSAVLVETRKGMDFFMSVGGLNRFETTIDRIISGNPSVIKSPAVHRERGMLIDLFRREGLFPAMKNSKTMRYIRLEDKLKKIHLAFFIKIIKKL